MIDAIKAIDTGKHSVILKWQLSLPDGINVPIDHDVFDFAYKYGNEQGYKTTSSVADLESLKFLLQYDVPFVKLPNDRKLDWLMDEIPRKIPVYVSKNENTALTYCREKLAWCPDNSEPGFLISECPIADNVMFLYCISKYPATIEEYESGDYDKYYDGISDHTIGLELYKKYQPAIWEKHFVLEHDKSNPDGGLFAITPAMLAEVL